MPDTSAPGVSVACGAGGKGAWTQLIAATTEEYKALLVSIGLANGNSVLVDIGLGASGSETPIATNLMCIGSGPNLIQATTALPITIPSGSRISARAASNAAVASLVVTASGLKHSFVTFDGMESSHGSTSYYGATVATSTTPTPGSWVQLVASTSRAYDAILPMFSNAGVFANLTRRHWFDFALGAGGSEVAFVENLGIGDESNGDTVGPKIGPLIRKAIPAGSRIAVRGKTSTSGNSTASVMLGLFHGARFPDLAGPLVL